MSAKYEYAADAVLAVLARLWSVDTYRRRLTTLARSVAADIASS